MQFARLRQKLILESIPEVLLLVTSGLKLACAAHFLQALRCVIVVLLSAIIHRMRIWQLDASQLLTESLQVFWLRLH